jgi:hypothetical protein
MQEVLAKVRAGIPLTMKEREAVKLVHHYAPESLQSYITESAIEIALQQSTDPSVEGSAATPAGDGTQGQATLQIQSSIWIRILWAVLGGLTAVLAGAGTVWGYQHEGFDYATLIALAFTAFGFGSALIGSRPKWIKADGESVTYIPPVGKPRVFPRSTVAGITNVSGGRGGNSTRFIGQDGKKLFTAGMGFEDSDVRSLARFLGISYY